MGTLGVRLLGWKFGRSRPNRKGIMIEPKRFAGTLGPAPLDKMHCWPIESRPPHTCYRDNFTRSRSQGMSVITEIRRKVINPSRLAFQEHSRSAELTGIDRLHISFSIITIA